MRLKRWLSTGLLVTLMTACTAEDAPEPRTRGDSPTASADVSTARPLTARERVRAVVRDRTPDPDDVIALAKTPMAWTRGTDTILVEYGLFARNAEVIAAQVVDRRGRVRHEWIAPETDDFREYWPVGRDYVGMSGLYGMEPHGPPPVLMRDGAPVPLRKLRGARPARPGEMRFGRGWLLDRAAGTVSQERFPGCRQDSIRVDEHRRVWCLDDQKTQIFWSDDGGRTWARHALSDSYFEYCDGCALGAELMMQDDAVGVALYRADFSLDRGRTWHDVDLPLALIGADRGIDGSFPNCTFSGILSDGRLVIGHLGDAVATDPSNTQFARVRPPRGAPYIGTQEGVLVADSESPLGKRFVSYDGGVTWQPPRVSALVRHLLPRTVRDR
jgi:hypothetical protein